jgi:hypothetical protein
MLTLEHIQAYEDAVRCADSSHESALTAVWVDLNEAVGRVARLERELADERAAHAVTQAERNAARRDLAATLKERRRQNAVHAERSAETQRANARTAPEPSTRIPVDPFFDGQYYVTPDSLADELEILGLRLITLKP